MRNLKKILALVLALVMSLSLMATAGAADFTDASSINEKYQTAIEVLEGLGVFKGYQDGTFQPTGSITRAETAAIIYRIVTGDVKDEQVGIYADYNLFTDVPSTSWFAGYVNYCANAEYIKGVGGGKFEPNSQVTGYAALAMILRAIGYTANGGFTGSDWEVQTARTAEARKITKNILTGTLGQNANRETVAEILFQAILVNMVDHNVDNTFNGNQGYSEIDMTLGYKTFKLEEVTGVVMANEYADLESGSTLNADQTTLADLYSDKTYTVTNQKTTLDDIGESRLVYIQGGTKVLHMEDSGLNGKAETVDAAANLNALKSEAGATGDGEHFVNFDKAGDQISDYKLRYYVDFDGAPAAEAAKLSINRAAGEVVWDDTNKVFVSAAGARAEVNGARVTVTIAPKTTITSTDLYWMQIIFGEKDLYGTGNGTVQDGAVYVGSQSVYDISDVGNQYNTFKYSYDSFVAEFIYDRDRTEVTGNENGNWVKVIDNNGDGVVDYVLKTIYTVAQVRSAVDGKYALDVQDHVLMFDSMSAPGTYKECVSGSSSDKINTLTNQAVVSEDELTRGDVVYYALIDGKAQTYKAEVVTAKIEKVDHNTLTATTTDGDEFIQAGVHEHIEDEAYMHFVRNLSGNVSYDLFLVRGRHLGAFVKTDAAGKFRLITNAWFDQLKAGGDYAVRVYDDETGKTKDVDISTNPTLFIGTTGTLNNNWFALKYFGDTELGYRPSDATYGEPATLNGDGEKIHTIVAAVDEENGIIVPVENSSVTGRYQHNILDLHYVENGKQYSKLPLMAAAQGYVYDTAQSSATRTAYNQLKTGVKYDIRALTSTVYYVVYPDATNNNEPVVWSRTVGYSNAPDLSKLKVEDIYAVGTLHEPDNNLTKDNYYLADVVVVELSEKPAGAQELIFVVDDLLRYQDVRYRRLQVIRDSGALDEIIVDFSGYTGGYWDNADNHKKVIPGLYYIEQTKNTIGDETIYRVVNQQSYNSVTTPLTASEIRDSGKIAAGQVNLVTYTGGKNYVVTRNWNTTDTIGSTIKNGWANPTGYSNKVYDPDDMRTNRTAEGTYEIPDSIPLYTLSYGRSWQWDTVTLGQYTGADFETVLAKHTDSTTDARTYQVTREDTDIDAYQNRTYFNYNDVMVFYSGSTAVYAISFANLYGTSTDDAQNIWLSTVPAKKTDTNYDELKPTVNFFTKAEKYDTLTDEISYADAAKAAKDGVPTITVKFNKDNNAISNVTVDGKQATKLDDGLTWTFSETVPTATKTYKLVVTYQDGKDNSIKSVTWDLTVKNAGNGAKFAAGGIVANVNGGDNSLTDAALPWQPILNWLKSAVLDADSQNATVKWTVTLNSGVVLTGTYTGEAGKANLTLTASDGKNYNETSNDTVANAVAVVTSENGLIKTVYAEDTVPATTGYTVTVLGDDITVFDKDWTGAIPDNTNKVTLTAAGTGKWTFTVPYGDHDIYYFTASGQGTWSYTNTDTNGSIGGVGTQLYCNSMTNVCRIQFAQNTTVDFTKTPDNQVTAVQILRGANVVNAGGAGAGKVVLATRPFDAWIDHDIDLTLTPNGTEVIKSVVWQTASGAQGNAVKTQIDTDGNGVDDATVWRIPANTLTVGGPVTINAVVVSADRFNLTVTNSAAVPAGSFRNLHVTYTDVNGDPQDVPVAGGASSGALAIPYDKTVTITVDGDEKITVAAASGDTAKVKVTKVDDRTWTVSDMTDAATVEVTTTP